MSKHRQQQRRIERRRQHQREREIARKAEALGDAAENIKKMTQSLKDQRTDLSSGGWINLGMTTGPITIKTIGGAWEGPIDEQAVDKPVKTFSECVVGYRKWIVDSLGQLRAITMTKQVWVPGVNEARCRPHDSAYFGASSGFFEGEEAHAAPHEDCHCGLYGWNDVASNTPTIVNDAGQIVVYGAIAAWGDLRVHATGFRASNACPTALSYDDRTESCVLEVLARVADKYHVALVHVDALQGEAERHGTALPDDVRPSDLGDDHIVNLLLNSYWTPFWTTVPSQWSSNIFFRGV